MPIHVNQITREVIGAAIEVHRCLGPGLLESAYRKCLARELGVRGIPFRKEWPLPLEYKGIYLECGYRVDLYSCQFRRYRSEASRGARSYPRGAVVDLFEAG